MQNANPVSLRIGAAVVALLAFVAAGCGSGKTSDAPPAIRAAADYFTIELGRHPVRLQIAVLPSEQERGLMQRLDLGKDDGMIFVFGRPQKQSFWMRNTPEPLDIAYATKDGAIAEIYPMYPFDERPIYSRSDEIDYAIEMPQGWYAANGVRPGDRVDLKAVADALKARGFEPGDYMPR